MPRPRSNAVYRAPQAATRALKSYRRRRNRRNRITNWKKVVRFGTGFPKQAIVTHKYIDNFNLASTTGAPAGYVISCNGMFDPNISGTGHQPMYFDQFSAIYDHYVVIGSKITIKAAGNLATSVPVVIGLFINDDTTITTGTVQAISEQSSAKMFKMNTGGGQATTMTLNWSAKKYFGGSIMSNTELQGTSAANPAEQSYFTIYVQSADGTASTTTVFWVEVEYIAVWKELKDIAQS